MSPGTEGFPGDAGPGEEVEKKDITIEATAREDSLRALAERALREMIVMGKLAPGDLIKILGMEEAGPEGGAPRDFVIRLVED